MFIQLILIAISILKVSGYTWLISPKELSVNVEESIYLLPVLNESLVVDIKDTVDQKSFFSKFFRLKSDVPIEVKFKLKEYPINGKVIISFLRRNGEKVSSIVSVRNEIGFGFIQTDKPIYTPRESVKIRMMRLDNELIPLKDSIKLQIMNPQKIKMEQIYFHPENESSFFLDYEFNFPPLPLNGMWHCILSYGSNFQAQQNVSFEVREYIKPTFSIVINSPKIVLPSDKVIKGSVDVKYVYGKPVNGSVTFKFGIKNSETGGISFIGLTTSKKLNNGHSDYKFSVEEIKSYFWFPKLNGDILMVEAIVQEESTGKKEKAIDFSTKFSSTAYKISFQKSFIDFKPLRKTFVIAEVLDVNDQHVPNVQVKVTFKNKTINFVSNNMGQINITFIPEKRDLEIKLEAITADPNITYFEQGSAEHILKVHDSPIAQLTIMNKKNEYKLGDYLESEILFEGSTFLYTHVYYFIMVRNQIVQFNRVNGSHIKIKIEKYMAPQMRIIVFTFGYARILADSLKINIIQDCNFKIDYENKEGVSVRQIKPGDEGNLVISGTDDQEVAFLAVDEAVYLLRNKDKLIKKKVLNIIKSREVDCGPGGGVDPFDVLFNSGLLIVGHQSSVGSFCKVSKKRDKRNVNQFNSKYAGFLYQCCLLGREKDRKMRKCETRASILTSYISDYECYQTFMKCCQAAEPFLYLLRLGGVMYNRNNKDHVHFAHEEEIADSTLSRTDFRETWLFELVKPNQSVFKHKVVAPHSITTWSINAISLSKTQGICIIDQPLRITVFQSIFMQITLPYSVMRNEQVEMLVTLFNYQSITIPVLVYLIGQENICTEADSGEKARKYVTLPPFSSKTVGFPMIPLKTGKFNISVKSLSYEGSDAVIQTLYVIPQGIPVEDNYILHLDPSNRQLRRKRSIEDVNMKDEIDSEKRIQKSEIITNPQKQNSKVVTDSEECVVSAIADQFGPTVKTSLSNIERLIRKPTGCGEQTIAMMAPTLYTLKYLNSTNQLQKGHKKKGIRNLRDGYKKELMYRKTDGSFSAFKRRPASLWLTAFVMKIFCSASPFLGSSLSNRVIEEGINWLLKHQAKDGSWIETHSLLHKELMSGLNGKVPMTAFVLGAIRECLLFQESPEFVYNLINSTLLAEKYLVRNKKFLLSSNSAYKIALVANSLAFSSNNLLVQELLDKVLDLSEFNQDLNQRFWKDPLSIEIASYTLLALLRSNNQNGQNDPAIQAVANFLNSKRTYLGTYDSTQETSVALEALSKFSQTQYSQVADTKLICNITTESKKFQRSIEFSKKNSLIMHSFAIDDPSHVIKFVTKGDGIGHVSVKVKYNILEPPEKLCKFDINITIKEERQKHLGINSLTREEILDELEIFPEDLMKDLDIDLSRSKRALFGLPDWTSSQINTTSRKRDGLGTGESVTTFKLNSDLSILNTTEINENTGFRLIYYLKVCTRYLNQSEAGMSIMDIGIPTGFVASTDDLEYLIGIRKSLISRYEITSRSVVLYLDSVPTRKPYCIQFKIVRENRVANLQLTPVKVYDYYSEDQSCTQLYSPTRLTDYLNTCNVDTCKCGQIDNCPSKDRIIEIAEISTIQMANARERFLELICSPKYTFAWTGQIVSYNEKYGMIWLRFQIEQVFKGTERQGNIQMITISKSCSKKMDLTNFSKYLIIGKNNESSSVTLEEKSIVFNLNEDYHGLKLHFYVKLMIQHFVKSRRSCY